MDHEILTLFSLEEFTDLSNGMTAKSTKSKRKADIPPDANWGNTNQPQPDTEKRSPFCTVTIASQQSETPISAPDLDTRIRWANELRRQAQTNY